MRFLLDQDVYAGTLQLLIELKHDALPVAQAGHARTGDIDLLRIAQEQDRIFVTRDRDFGELVFVNRLGAGVIYLRISPGTLHAVHAELEAVLKAHSEEELRAAFVVVEPGRHRFRRLAPGV
jgi:predicted nuclease of predicted toxin-antitoxin system